MGKLTCLMRMLECFRMGSSGCLCMNYMDEKEEMEKLPLVEMDSNGGQKRRGRVRVSDDEVPLEKQTLAFELKPKVPYSYSFLILVYMTKQFQLCVQMVILRVSMHCHGCARKVEKHISKMDGVTSYKVDLESKMVVVTGDILPFEVLQSLSKVKHTELWDSSKAQDTC
ncbi:hypothetical protein SAY87_029188 [Trapa incisa]|uniref:HMA domain-containing protein n=1 Tax=Trapa incisa TaxID=236973 RepID=A0AAN7QPH8_9MYRT|nr:hypothetical protein SAY87_029188 [Trapa incisa]